jgi:hypothetical protein
MTMYDLAVAYRIYPGVSKSPAYFSSDKLALSTLCLESFRAALGGLRVKVFAVLDGCPAEYEELFVRVLRDCDFVVVAQEAVGNLATFSQQIDLLLGETEAPYVYFAEDDYFYLPNAVEKMVEWMRGHGDVDFVTPYDHPNSYSTSSRYERHLVRPDAERYWRTASSTCLTFLTSRENLVRTQWIFRSYSRGNHDCSLWLALTQKFELLNPRIQWADRPRVMIWGKAWVWGIRWILLGRRYRLWCPMPALATHMEAACVSPLVDWQEKFERAEREMAVPALLDHE